MVRSRTRATWSKKRGPCHGDRFCGWSTTKFHGANFVLFHKITLPKTNSCLGKDPFLWVFLGLFSRAQRTVVSRRVFTNILSLTNQYNECHKGFWAIQRSYRDYNQPLQESLWSNWYNGLSQGFWTLFSCVLITWFLLWPFLPWILVEWMFFFAIGKLQW